MTARNDTWRAMARKLSERLKNHAATCEHPTPNKSTAKDCSVCQDYLVWQEWYQKEMRALALDRVRAKGLGIGAVLAETKETSA